jgi:hypothetical protein
MIVLPVLAKKRTSQRSSVLSAHRGKAAIEPPRPPTTKADIAAHEDIMTRSLPYLLLALIAATGFSGTAGAANCDGDRKLYPKEWSAVAAETPLFTCNSRYLRLRVFLTRRDVRAAASWTRPAAHRAVGLAEKFGLLPWRAAPS